MVRLRHDDYTILLPDTMIWPGLFDVYAKSRFLRCMEPENRITSSLSVVTKQNFEAGKIRIDTIWSRPTVYTTFLQNHYMELSNLSCIFARWEFLVLRYHELLRLVIFSRCTFERGLRFLHVLFLTFLVPRAQLYSFFRT